MKRFPIVTVIAIVLCFAFLPAAAQQETILSGEIESGGYGAPEVKLSWLDGETAVLVGGRGGWIINHSFVLGGAGYGFATTHYIDDVEHDFSSRLEGGYGGLLLEYYVAPNRAVHFTVSSVIGAGGMALLEGYRSDWDGHTIDETAFFVAEPGAGIALNITTFFRIGVDASYRFVVGSNLIGFQDSDLSGAAVGLSLQFGGF